MKRKADISRAHRATTPSRPTTPSRRSAFSVIEVLVAMAIAGIGFLVISETFFNTLRVLGSLNFESNRENDIRFVRSQIIREPDLDTFEDGGEIETLNLGRAIWDAEVEETEVIDLFRVALVIEFDNPDGEPFEHSEVLYLLRPTWSDPIDRSILLDDAKRRLEDERLTGDWD